MFLISDLDLAAQSLGLFSLKRAKRDLKTEHSWTMKTTLQVGWAIRIRTLITMIMTATTTMMIIQRIIK